MEKETSCHCQIVLAVDVRGRRDYSEVDDLDKSKRVVPVTSRLVKITAFPARPVQIRKDGGRKRLLA